MATVASALLELLAVVFEPRSLGGRRDERVENRSASGGPMRKVLLAAAFAAAIVTVPAIAAPAGRVKCSGNRYGAIDPAAFPAIRNEIAVGLPRLTSGYAPRCLVADSIGGSIQQFWRHHQRLPHRLMVRGARWDAGRWRLGYRRRRSGDNPYRRATARHGREIVTMDLAS